MIAESIGSLCFVLYDGATERDTHPLLDLLRRPNPRQDGASFLEAVASHLLLAGNAYEALKHIEAVGRLLSYLDAYHYDSHVSGAFDDETEALSKQLEDAQRRLLKAPASETQTIQATINDLLNQISNLNARKALVPIPYPSARFTAAIITQSRKMPMRPPRGCQMA